MESSDRWSEDSYRGQAHIKYHVAESYHPVENLEVRRIESIERCRSTVELDSPSPKSHTKHRKQRTLPPGDDLASVRDEKAAEGHHTDPNSTIRDIRNSTLRYPSHHKTK